MHDWFNMGGYAFFVWGSYGTAVLSLMFLTIWVGLAHARAAKRQGGQLPP